MDLFLSSLGALVHKRAQHVQVFQARSRIDVGCFENEGSVGELEMLGHAAQGVSTDVAFAKVP